MAVYSPREPMPSHVHAQWIAVRENPGIHVNYPYGYAKFPDMDQKQLMHKLPRYTGYTFRVFFFATDTTSHTKVQIWYGNSWQSGSQVKDGKSEQVFSGEGIEGPKTEDWKVPVPAGSYYSMGVRYREDKWLQPVFNDKTGKEISMREALGTWAFHMNIFAANHVLLSIHLSDELGKHFPDDGLGKRVHYGNLEYPVGSSYTALCVYTGFHSKVTVSIHQKENRTLQTIFTGVAMKRYEEFVLYVRNTPEHWLVHVSFDTKPQVFKGKDYREYIDVEINHGAFLKKVTYDVMRG